MDGRSRSWPSALIWLAPTCRVIRAPLVGTVALGVLATATATLLDVASVTTPSWITSMMLGGFATCAALALADPAAGLLAAVPIGRARRAAHRLVIAVPVTLIAVGTINLVSHLLAAGEEAVPAMSVGGLLALVSLTAAADAWSSPWTAPAAAAIPSFIVVAARIVPPESLAGELVTSWSTHPWSVVTVATSLAVAGNTR